MLKVMFIDDEKILLQNYKIIFSTKDVEVYLESDPRKAIKLLDSRNIDICFTDFRMPDVSGLDIIKKCNKKKTNFFLVTAEASIEGCPDDVQVLFKPNQLDEIQKIISRKVT